MRNYKDNIIVKMTFQFALDVMNFSEKLRNQKRFAFADQLLRSGCSVGANVKEAQSAESKADFIHKLKIASKKRRRLSTGLSCVSLMKIILSRENCYLILKVF